MRSFVVLTGMEFAERGNVIGETKPEYQRRTENKINQTKFLLTE